MPTLDHSTEADDTSQLRAEAAVRELLGAMGEDLSRAGLERTPTRVAKAMRFLTSGSRTDVEELINGAVFEDSSDEMVIVKDIEVYSLCEHHLLPFHGRCHVGYLPKSANNSRRNWCVGRS